MYKYQKTNLKGKYSKKFPQKFKYILSYQK